MMKELTFVLETGQAMNAKLLVVVGNTTKREVALQLPAVLGRSRDADITVAHPLISRRHCELSEDHGLLVLRDLTSLNGTMIGGRRVEFTALLPDAEFTIGPLTFRVLYEYEGDLESVPATRFVAGPQEPAAADSARADEVPMHEIDEALPAEPASESISGDLSISALMALADADPEAVIPAAPPRRQAPSPAPSGTIGPQRPPLADHKRPTVPMEPLDDDSSLQSGGHAKESPWAVESRPMQKPQPALPTYSPRSEVAEDSAGNEPPAPPDATSAEEAADPPAATPPKGPGEVDEMDPEFGSFLEGLE